MNNFTLKIGTKTLHWTEAEVHQKLKALSKLEKSKGWITGELDVKPSSWISRLFWSLIAKHFQSLRDRYGVNLERSKTILYQLQSQIPPSNATIQKLFHSAVIKFQSIAPNHELYLIKPKRK